MLEVEIKNILKFRSRTLTPLSPETQTRLTAELQKGAAGTAAANFSNFLLEQYQHSAAFIAEAARLRALADDLLVLGTQEMVELVQSLLAAKALLPHKRKQAVRIHFVETLDTAEVITLLETLDPARTALVLLSDEQLHAECAFGPSARLTEQAAVESLARVRNEILLAKFLVLRRWFRVSLGHSEMRARTTLILTKAETPVGAPGAKNFWQALARHEGLHLFMAQALTPANLSTFTTASLVLTAYVFGDFTPLLVGALTACSSLQQEILTSLAAKDLEEESVVRPRMPALVELQPVLQSLVRALWQGAEVGEGLVVETAAKAFKGIGRWLRNFWDWQRLASWQRGGVSSSFKFSQSGVLGPLWSIQVCHPDLALVIPDECADFTTSLLTGVDEQHALPLLTPARALHGQELAGLLGQELEQKHMLYCEAGVLEVELELLAANEFALGLFLGLLHQAVIVASNLAESVGVARTLES